MKINIWSDFACPYCYIGETRLRDAIKEMGYENEVLINYRAFELDPSSGVTADRTTLERMMEKYNLSEEEAKGSIADIDTLGRECGIEFHYGTARYTNTFMAHRLMKYAEAEYDRDVTERLNNGLFEAYFVKNEELSDKDVLRRVAVESGLNEDGVTLVLESDRYGDDVRYDEREAAMRSVRGVPYIMFDELFAVPGALSTEGFKTALLKAKEHERLSENPVPKECAVSDKNRAC